MTLTGRYYYPREEERIVLFLDLVDLTSIAERIGNVRFHAMLSETFTRLSQVVTDFGGEVYRYVGDALIATWPLGTPEENAPRSVVCSRVGMHWMGRLQSSGTGMATSLHFVGAYTGTACCRRDRRI